MLRPDRESYAIHRNLSRNRLLPAQDGLPGATVPACDCRCDRVRGVVGRRSRRPRGLNLAALARPAESAA